MIKGLLSWYHTACDGDWEHSFGFQIETADNPGLIVTVDIEDHADLDPARDRMIARVADEHAQGDVALDLRVANARLHGFAAPGNERRLFAQIDKFLGVEGQP